jgi:flagellar protein FlaI
MPWISVIKRLRFDPKPYSKKRQESLQRDPIYLKDEVEQRVDDVLNRLNNNEVLKTSMVIEDHTTLIKRKTKNKKKATKSLEPKIESTILVPIALKEDTTVNNNYLKDDLLTTTIKTGDDVISEQIGFGWNGLGSRRIIFDNIFKEYRYEILEPQLTTEEEEHKNKIIYLFRIHADLDVFDWDENKKKQHLENALQKIINENNIDLEGESKDKIFYHIFREFMGYGKIDILMHDGEIEDISCDGHGIPIFIHHRDYESIKTNIIFNSSDELDSFVVKLSQMCGKQISVYEPIVDGKLSDGSRLQTTLAKTITKHSTFTIRRFRTDPLTPTDLISNNTLSIDMAAYFWLAIEKGASALFCGGTATGKTTMLNALSLFLPPAYKIVSIEDTREINLPHVNWIAGTTRQGFLSTENNKTGKDIDMFDLIKVALRQRPRVIIVGEVRGKEAYALFQAMTTGHQSYSTLHADDIHSLIQRLESAPISLPRSLLTSLDLVIFLKSVTVRGLPARRITNVTEIVKIDPETNRLVTMTPFHWISEIDDRFEGNGGSRLFNKIKQYAGWSDEKLIQEIKNRIIILEWMVKENIRSYEEVGRIISEYSKDPKAVLTKVKGVVA